MSMSMFLLLCLCIPISVSSRSENVRAGNEMLEEEDYGYEQHIIGGEEDVDIDVDTTYDEEDTMQHEAMDSGLPSATSRGRSSGQRRTSLSSGRER